MSTAPSTFTLGQTTQSQLLALPELAPTDYVNTAGVPDTKEDCNTRANAVYARFIREALRQINNVFIGTQIVPGIAGVAGKAWRQGDDGSDTVVALDMSAYGVQLPNHLWLCNGDGTAEIGGVAFAGTYFNFDMVNARGGVNGEDRFVYALRSFSGKSYRSIATIPTLVTNLAFCMFVNLSQWNQANDGIVLASYRAWDRANETGASYRLGFEIGLGCASGLETGEALSLYYRHVGSDDVEVIKFLDLGGPFSISFPFGREVCIGFIRGADAIQIYINGLLAYSAGYASPPVSGTAAEMRLTIGAAWDGSKYNNGSVRNVALWTTAFPNAAQMLSYYRVGAGFLPKAEPA